MTMLATKMNPKVLYRKWKAINPNTTSPNNIRYIVTPDVIGSLNHVSI